MFLRWFFIKIGFYKNIKEWSQKFLVKTCEVHVALKRITSIIWLPFKISNSNKLLETIFRVANFEQWSPVFSQGGRHKLLLFILFLISRARKVFRPLLERHFLRCRYRGLCSSSNVFLFQNKKILGLPFCLTSNLCAVLDREWKFYLMRWANQSPFLVSSILRKDFKVLERSGL